MKLSKRTLMIVPAIVSSLVSYAQSPVKDKEQAEKYFALTKAYGYIRYFYPGDAAAAIDWDKFAFYSAKIVDQSSGADFNKHLASLFQTLAPGSRIRKTGDMKAAGSIGTARGLDSEAVYWQHLGDGKASIGYPYKSMRVNRPANVLPESTDDFGWLVKSLPVEGLKGKELRFSVEIMADPLFNGFSNLVIAVRQKAGDRVLHSTEGQPIFSDKWSKHTVNVKLPDSTETITVSFRSATLTGAVRFDNLLIEIKEEGDWKVKERTDFNQTTKEELVKTWRASGPNNDIVLKTGQDNQWVNFSRSKGAIKQSAALFNKSPEPDEWIQKEIGKGLSIAFPLVLYTAQVDVSGNDDYQQLIRAIDAIPAADYNAGNLYCRIANIMILWNKIQHFHPGNPLSKTQWEEQLRKALLQSIRDKTIEEHRNTLTQMIAPLNDSHMVLFYSPLIRQEFYLPLEWEKIEDKIVVTNVLDPALPISPGDIVTHIDGMPAKKYWDGMMKSVTGATAARRQFRVQSETVYGLKATIVKIKTEKHPAEIALERKISESEFKSLAKKKVRHKPYQQIEPGIFYINLSEITWADLQLHLPEMAGARGLIFDLRGYPNWQTHRVVSHFVKEPVYQMKYGTPEIIYPDKEKMSFYYGTGLDTLFPLAPFIVAPKVFLTNGRAVSYSEDFLNLVNYYKLADIVGDTTAGTTGIINMCYLFGGLYVPWTGMQVSRQDGSLFNGVGVIPTHPVRKTIKALKEGRDEYIEQALKNIREKNSGH